MPSMVEFLELVKCELLLLSNLPPRPSQVVKLLTASVNTLKMQLPLRGITLSKKGYLSVIDVTQRGDFYPNHVRNFNQKVNIDSSAIIGEAAASSSILSQNMRHGAVCSPVLDICVGYASLGIPG